MKKLIICIELQKKEIICVILHPILNGKYGIKEDITNITCYCRMLKENYADYMKPENEFWVKRIDDSSLMLDCKRDVVEKIMNKIEDIKTNLQ